MTDTFITQLVIERLRAHLTNRCQLALPEDDPTRMDEVKIGREQTDPKKRAFYLSISGGSQTDPDLRDGIVSLRTSERIGIVMPVREIGGGQVWWRFGEVKIGCFFVNAKIDETLAMRYSYAAFGRLLANIENLYIADLRDSFSEQASQMFCYASTYMESGGSGHYIWRGSARWVFSSIR